MDDAFFTNPRCLRKASKGNKNKLYKIVYKQLKGCNTTMVLLNAP